MGDLVQILPQIFFYIAIGYVYIHSYRFVRVIENEPNISSALIEYTICGFVIKSIFSLIPITINYVLDNIIIMILSIIVGYGVATLIQSSLVVKICSRLKIQQTPNLYVWHEVGDKENNVYVEVEDDKGLSYLGVLVNTETYQRFPIIRLALFEVYKNDKLIEDHTDDPTRVIMIDTSKFSVIRLYYAENSRNIKRWSYEKDIAIQEATSKSDDQSKK